jgi:AbiV family abortive infection protein
MGRRRTLPTAQEALDGIPLAIANAARHLDAARVLADAGLYGPAMAHLVYSLEEAEKARSIGQVWLNSWEPRRPDRPTDDELKARVFEHAPRHKAAASKSWASGPFWTAMSEHTRERVRLSPAQTAEQRVAMAYAAHPESLPLDWEDKAYLIREGALYVDLREDGWHTPDQFVANDYTALRLQAVHYLQGVTAAFERHKQLHAERKRVGGAA